jgi:hypothetical protein
MNDHYIQKQQYNEYIIELENLLIIKYNHSFENGSLTGGVQPHKILYMGCWYNSNVDSMGWIFCTIVHKKMTAAQC